MATKATERRVRVKLEPDDYLGDGRRVARVYEVDGQDVILEDACSGETWRVPAADLGDWRVLRRAADPNPEMV